MNLPLAALRKLLFGQTAAYAVLLFSTLLGAGEIGFRVPALQRQLPSQGITLDYLVYNEKLTLFDTYSREHGNPDCIFVGNSLVLNDVNIEAFQEQTNNTLSCFNFGVSGLDAAGSARVAKTLVDQYHPRLLIVGLSLADFALASDESVEQGLLRNPYIRYRDGQFSWQGWGLANSYWLRYLRTIQVESSLSHHLVAQTYDPVNFTYYGLNGYLPAIFYGEDAPRFAGVSSETSPKGYVPDPRDVAGLQEYVELDVPLLFVEMPTSPNYQIQVAGSVADYRTILDNLIEAAVGDRQIPYWHTSNLDFSSTDWADTLHLFYSASFPFSRWLGEQVAQAIKGGLLEGGLPNTLPLADLPLGARETPISEDITQRVADQHVIPADALLFNPAQRGISVPDALPMLLVRLEWDKSLTQNAQGAFRRDQMLNLASLLSQMYYEEDLSADQQAEIEQWRQDKQARYLRAADIDYLIVTDSWYGWLNAEETLRLSDPDHYQAIGHWDHELTRETYFLYRVLDGN